MTVQATLAVALDRKPPAMGGFSPRIVRLEVRRLLRNRRTLVLAIAMPVIFYATFGFNPGYASDRVGHGNETAFVMISMALYGAVYSAASAGAMVSVERISGWSRQLRVTPLSPLAYIMMKMLTALVLSAGAVGALYVVGAMTHASMPADTWLLTALCVWIGSVLFAAFGLFFGYLLPSENLLQVVAVTLMLCSFLGGLFIPLSHFPSGLQQLALYTPLYGLNELVHYPLVGGGLKWQWVLNLFVWLAIFVAGAVWRFRGDTARV